MLGGGLFIGVIPSHPHIPLGSATIVATNSSSGEAGGARKRYILIVALGSDVPAMPLFPIQVIRG